MSKAYEERYKTSIGEYFKEDSDVIEKLYDIMGKEKLSYERDELFTELISVMKDMREEIDALTEVVKRQQERQTELEGKNLNTLLVEQAKDVASTTKAEYEAAKEAFVSTKDRIVSTIKDALAQYYQKGKMGLLNGIKKLCDSMHNKNHDKLRAVNKRVEKRSEKLERLGVIEKELNKTKTQIVNLFRTMVGFKRRPDKEYTNYLLKLVVRDLNVLNDTDLKQAERLLHSSKRLERLKEKLDGLANRTPKKKVSLNDQMCSAKKEKQKQMDMKDTPSYQKNDRRDLRSFGRT